MHLQTRYQQMIFSNENAKIGGDRMTSDFMKELLSKDEKKKICYHTFHSTKGLEYENVAIILGKDFGQDKDLFKYYFMNYEGNEEQDSDKYEKGRNILYVAITRAIKNLRVLYIDDFEEIKDGIEKVFEKAYAFTNEISIDDFQ